MINKLISIYQKSNHFEPPCVSFDSFDNSRLIEAVKLYAGRALAEDKRLSIDNIAQWTLAEFGISRSTKSNGYKIKVMQDAHFILSMSICIGSGDFIKYRHQISKEEGRHLISHLIGGKNDS